MSVAIVSIAVAATIVAAGRSCGDCGLRVAQPGSAEVATVTKMAAAKVDLMAVVTNTGVKFVARLVVVEIMTLCGAVSVDGGSCHGRTQAGSQDSVGGHHGRHCSQGCITGSNCGMDCGHFIGRPPPAEAVNIDGSSGRGYVGDGRDKWRGDQGCGQTLGEVVAAAKSATEAV